MFSALTWVSVFFILGAVLLFIMQLIAFSRLWANFPAGMTIAGIPVGGLDRQGAAERLLQVYAVPVELHYGEAIVQVSPTVFGFELEMEKMLTAAELERVRQPFWMAFWNYLWNRAPAAVDIPLSVITSDERIRVYLTTEVAARYDQPPQPATPVVGTVEFRSGQQGTALDVERSILLVDNALRSATRRVVYLPLQRTAPTRPPFQNLAVMLRQTIDLSGFDGTIGVYVADLQTGEETYILLQGGEPVPAPPDVAFSASSTIKIPIMVSAFRRLPDDPGEAAMRNLEDMIARSINPASDWVMENLVDPLRGPLVVTEDMQALGLENTFLAGMFYTGAPLLRRYSTSANQRTDINNQPDPYSQTTPAEMGMLLTDVYQCAYTDGGALLAAFAADITPVDCQAMIDYLVQDRIALLIQAGVPDGTKVAHKHGWVPDIYGIIHDMSDAAIVFTPGGDYVITVYLYHPVQLVFDPSHQLIRDLARAVYNFYNLPIP
jgi:beta-lactamase class A